MAFKQLFLASVVLLSVSFAVGDEYGGIGFPIGDGCNSWERSYLSRTCLSPFRYAHTGIFGGFGSCMPNRLQCSAASTCWSCINQCRPRLSAGCWGGISTAITSILRSYNFGCSFQQIQSTCASTLPTLAIPAMTGISGGWPGAGIFGGWPGAGISGISNWFSGLGGMMGLGNLFGGLFGGGSCMGSIC